MEASIFSMTSSIHEALPYATPTFICVEEGVRLLNLDNSLGVVLKEKHSQRSFRYKSLTLIPALIPGGVDSAYRGNHSAAPR